MASGKQTDVAVMDFSKDFDNLRWTIMASKTNPQIKAYGYKQQNIKLDRGMVIT
jgi:hypothetical protein